MNMKLNIERQGRAWNSEEIMERFQSFPEKMEIVNGKLYWTDEDRINMLAILLENVGIDEAVRLGNSMIGLRQLMI